MSFQENIATIILAAGSSSRLNRPKQSLIFQEKTLLQRIISTANSLNYGPVVTVIGTHTIGAIDDCKDTVCVINENWQEGMASSIRCGVSWVQESYPNTAGVIITVCDQPFISKTLLNQLVDIHYKDGLPIVACSYGNTMGTPAFFDRSIFNELEQLEGDKGAKQILYKDPSRVAVVDFPLGSIDIDTEKDYDELLKREI